MDLKLSPKCGAFLDFLYLGSAFQETQKHVYYHVRNESPVQVRYRIQDAWGWCTGMTQRDDMGREVGRGFRIGNSCAPVVDSCWCMAEPIKYCKIIFKINFKKRSSYSPVVFKHGCSLETYLELWRKREIPGHLYFSKNSKIILTWTWILKSDYRCFYEVVV